MMPSSKLILRLLRPEDEASFKKACAVFNKEAPSIEFAFGFDASIPFIDYLNKLEGWALGKGLPDNFVACSYLVGVVDDQVVGRLSIRHRLNDHLERIGGHVGYGVIPSCRGKGYATEMLKQAFPICASIGIGCVLLTCDIDNVASRRVIEKCGGIFERLTDEQELKIQKRRYWIDCNRSF